MKEDLNRQSCGRADDLIGFLYCELGEDEGRRFRMHLQDCGLCRAQLASFTNVRESIVAWRNESIGGFRTAPDTPGTVVNRQRPSAVTALRAFFNLSPIWMKGAVAFVSVLFCLFAVLAISRLRETPSQVVTPAQQQRSEQELNALVERRVQEELRRSKDSLQADTIVKDPASDQASLSQSEHRNNKQRVNLSKRNPRRPLTKGEREQLAADLRLIPGTNNSELELLDDRINQ